MPCGNLGRLLGCAHTSQYVAFVKCLWKRNPNGPCERTQKAPGESSEAEGTFEELKSFGLAGPWGVKEMARCAANLGL